MTYTIATNAEYGSLEIRFESKPTPAVLSALKTRRFRWHHVGRYWYGKGDENALREELDKLTARAEKIAAANRQRSDRGPVAPTPKPGLVHAPSTWLKVVSEPAFADKIMETVTPALENLENVVRAETERVLAETAETPETPETPAFPSLDQLKPLAFSYRIGNSCGQANFSLDLLENASASTLKVIYPMIDGIEDAEERKNAWFTLTALAYYKAAENPEKRPAFRSAADLYREKTGEDFPTPETEESGKPAASKTVTAACKRIAKNAPTGWNALVSDAGRSIISTTFCVVCLTSCAPDLALTESENADKIAGFIRNAEEQEHDRALPLPKARDLKAWIKCQPAPRKNASLYYELDGLFVDARHLLDVLEALPGCTAYIPRVPNIYSPILFVSGDDRGILMQLRPRTEESAA